AAARVPDAPPAWAEPRPPAPPAVVMPAESPLWPPGVDPAGACLFLLEHALRDSICSSASSMLARIESAGSADPHDRLRRFDMLPRSPCCDYAFGGAAASTAAWLSRCSSSGPVRVMLPAPSVITTSPGCTRASSAL